MIRSGDTVHTDRAISDRTAGDGGFCSAQASIRARCFHSDGHFVPFNSEKIEKSIGQLFEQQAIRHGEQIAVTSKNEVITYAQLNRMANGTARAVLSKCGATHRPVALLLERSGDSIAGFLGLLKAGKICVPLDAKYPPAKLSAILKDCSCELILSDSRTAPLARELTSDTGRVLCMDELDATHFSVDIGGVSSGDGVAAIFYTSGSTGKPKGVVQTHRSILHRVMIDTNTFHICPEDRLSLLTAPTYSVSLRNLFSALLNGAKVAHFDVEGEGLVHLGGWLKREKITIYFSVPTVFRRLMENVCHDEDLSTVRLIYLGGEGAAKTDFELYKKHFSRDCILVNALGSNEAGIIREYFMDHGTEIAGNMVPAGYEVEDKEILLVDDCRQPVACGQIGEIAVRSAYLAAGYWQQPGLTDAAFHRDPEIAERRIYFTGDLGRMLADGCLVYLGRKDARVKIRGIGIEIAEIETALLEHKSLKEAVVVAVDDSRNEKQLVAYVVPAQPFGLTPKELRKFLLQKLPDHMIPSGFVFVDSLPLTTNGKIDRQSLPLLQRPAKESGEPFVAARTLLEKELAEIWGEVLGVNRVGIYDNFFDLGGHSLSASQVMARVQNHLHLDLPLAVVFVNPTVAEMAEIIAQYQREAKGNE